CDGRGPECRTLGGPRLRRGIQRRVRDVARVVLRRGGRENMRVGRVVAALVGLALIAPAAASAGAFHPSDEFQLKDWVPIHLGPLDLSINRAVVYLFVGAAISIVLGLVLMRWRLKIVADTRQTVGEVIYDIAQTQVAETGLPTKAMSRWFPYC